MSDEEKSGNLRDMVSNYGALARKAARYWPRALVLFVLVASAGMYWVVKKPRMFKSEASATIHDVTAEGGQSLNPEEALAELRARLDQVYGSRANLGRIVDELHLYPWLHGKTSHLKIIEAFQDGMTYTASGRDAFHLDFVYQDPAIAQRVVQRLLRLYTDERRASGQAQSRNDLSSVDTALAGLEQVLGDQEDRLTRFEHANHDMVEQVRARRLGQLQARMGVDPMMPGIGAMALPAGDPTDSVRTRRLRIRAAALSARMSAVQRAMSSPSLPAAIAAPAAPVEESERIQTLRHNATDLRERLARLRTTYTDEYPDVQMTVRRLADAERDLSAAVAADRASRTRTAAPIVAAGATPEALRAQLASIQRDLDETRAALVASARDDRAHAPATPAPAVAAAAHPAAAPTPAPAAPEGERLGSLVEVESMWDRLTGEATTTRTRYQQLLTRKFELQAAIDTMSATGADVLRVIDPPSLAAEPEPPGRTKLALGVLVAALVLALGTAGLSGFLDSRVYQPADLRRWGELPELPAIPDLRAMRISDVTPRRAATARSGG